VLPLSQIGGYVLGARSVIVQGINGISVAASTVVDATLEFSAQITYAAIGLTLFMWLSPNRAIAEFVVAGLCVGVIVAVAFITLQRRRSDFLPRLAKRLAGSRFSRIVNNAAAVQTEIQRLARFERVWLSYLLHLGAWFVSAFEAWLALRMMGAALGFATVLAIESMVYAMRAMAFAVPSALGVQEGAYIVLGAAFGLPPEFALGVSLLKRGRDLILGIPALLTWQISESRKRWSGGTLRPLAIPLDPSSAKRR
jgi:glycosyltransferase 2 family protein